MGITFDYHSHHYRCGHAAGEMSHYIESARSQGLTTFGLSDHCPPFFLNGDDPQPQTTMAKSELATYVEEALALKRHYSGSIDVRVGIEADFVEGSENVYRDVLDSNPFDYVLGSVHWVNGISIFHRPRWQEEDPEATYREYFRLVAASVKTGMFDIVSHPTAIEAYGPPVDDALAAELYPPLVEAIAESGMIVEANTSGFRKMGGDDPFPNRRMLRLLVEAGVPLTFGSDCHQPAEVGFGRERVEAILRDLGVDMDTPRPITIRREPILAFTRP